MNHLDEEVCVICGSDLCPCCGACTNRDCEIYRDQFPPMDGDADDFLENKYF